MKIFNNKEDDSQWLPISDLMTVLMAVFLIISIVFMIQIKSGVNNYIKTKNNIYSELKKEFQNENWPGYEIDSLDLSIKFISPEILFDFNSFYLKKDFKKILDSFFPRYIEILSKDQFKSEIDEIIIEGHTDSQYQNSTSEDIKYFGNMELSQNRAREVLKYSLLKTLKENNSTKAWARSKLSAHGFSYNRPYMVNKKVDNKKSRRVEFKIKLTAESKIYELAK